MVKEPKTLEHCMQNELNTPVNNDLDTLFRTYGDMVYRLALVRTRSVADAEEKARCEKKCYRADSEEDEQRDSTVYDAVMRLPEKYRTAIHLYYYEDYSVSEIASLMKTNESTVKSWLHRARGMLKEELGGEYEV